MAVICQGLCKDKDTAGPFPLIFDIFFPDAAGFYLEGTQNMVQQLIWLFIHAHNRDFFFIRKFISIQYFFHTGYKFCILFWVNAPVFVFVMLKFIFLKQNVLFPQQPAQ